MSRRIPRVSRDELAPKREKKSEFAGRVNREVPLENLEHLAVAKFAKSEVAYDSLEEAFPPADPALIPVGTDVLVQIRTPKKRTKGGIYLPEETRETDLWNLQTARVIAMGPTAFRNRETMEPWPECAAPWPLWKRWPAKFWGWLTGVRALPPIRGWVMPGEHTRVPKYGGDRWWMDVSGSDEKALFVLFDDLVMKGKVPDDRVLSVVAYI
jgi:hypothetical protein